MKCLIDKINGKPGEYQKDFMKIRFALDDSLSLNKTNAPKECDICHYLYF